MLTPKTAEKPIRHRCCLFGCRYFVRLSSFRYLINITSFLIGLSQLDHLVVSTQTSASLAKTPPSEAQSCWRPQSSSSVLYAGSLRYGFRATRDLAVFKFLTALAMVVALILLKLCHDDGQSRSLCLIST